MNRKKIITIFGALVLAFALSGCGDDKDTGAKTESAAAASASASEADEKEEVEEGVVIPDGYFAKAFENGEVENNGKQFVRVGSRVYYRLYNVRALELTTIGSPFIDEINSHVESTIMYYDLEKDETKEVCKVYGMGGLYVTVDGLCLSDYSFGGTTLITEDGTTNDMYYNGYVANVSPDGRSVALVALSDDGQNLIYVLYRDGNMVGSPGEGEEKTYCSGLGFSGNTLIGTVSDPTAMGDTIFSYDGDGEFTKLGTVDPYDMETYTIPAMIENVTLTDDGGYITAGYRDGTANALVAWNVYEFKSGKKNSLKSIKSGEISEEYDYAPPKVNVIDDKPVLDVHKTGDVFLSEHSYGDLMCRAFDGEDKVLYKDYISEPGEYDMFRDAIDAAVCFSDDAAFLVRTSGYRSPEEDVGWRTAYDLEKLRFECYRFDKAHIKDDKPQRMQLGELASAGWNKGEIEYDRLIGTWECHSAIVEGFNYDDYTGAGTVTTITFNKDGSAVLSYKDRESGQKTSEDKKLIKTGSGPEGDVTDYAFTYETEGEDPMKLGVCYLSHNRLGIYCLYHFDGGSTGWYLGSYYKEGEDNTDAEQSEE